MVPREISPAAIPDMRKPQQGTYTWRMRTMDFVHELTVFTENSSTRKRAFTRNGT